MRYKMILCLAILAMAFSLTSSRSFAEDSKYIDKGNSQSKESPFLIVNRLPHLTKILMQHWDDPALKLSEEQNTRLLVVRKETMAGVKAIAPQVSSLQKQVTEGIFSGKTPDELNADVQAISKLKTEATMIHLKCIFDTSAVLTPQQLDTLLAF